MDERDPIRDARANDGEVTRLLGEIGRGQSEAVNELLPLVYDELHRLARAYFRRERGEHTLQPTALVHEAYIRLVDQRAPLESRGHFMAVGGNANAPSAARLRAQTPRGPARRRTIKRWCSRTPW